MPGRAAGFRASDSVAEAVAFACPSPQTAEAMAMAKPEVIATQLVPPVVPPWAYRGAARNIAVSAINRELNFRIVILLLSIAASRWLTSSSCRRPHACGEKAAI